VEDAKVESKQEEDKACEQSIQPPVVCKRKQAGIQRESPFLREKKRHMRVSACPGLKELHKRKKPTRILRDSFVSACIPPCLLAKQACVAASLQ
jgi:hypothetical protein